MAYDVVATGKTPALIVYLLDISGSMSEPLDGAPKIEHVNRAIEQVLVRMVQRSTKGGVISPRYRLAMIAYSDTPEDILGGVRTIADVAQLGTPTLSVSRTTDTHAAFMTAREILRRELAQSAESERRPAPMVCHITDGQCTGSDPAPVAQEIMRMSTPDGPVLVENIYVGPGLTVSPIGDAGEWPGVMSEGELADPYARKLFHMSSPLPESYARVINESAGYALRPGARMLIPSSSGDLIELAFAMSGATPTA
ncbi:vWA domain-containing protein [Longimicrobium sp.]|uniref:vWA domain-containing protein n=1 Tax=Longimicrobium sp. TaxID=2029185 RepID=UPI002D0BDB09|nr:vWA domain-containing protein [Longimicrobium sp.]HSU17517.1 vWA domain-containing protein [Longimicrobium sp.]